MTGWRRIWRTSAGQAQTGVFMTDTTEPGELIYRRVHQAPRELLFDCMAQPTLDGQDQNVT